MANEVDDYGNVSYGTAQTDDYGQQTFNPYMGSGGELVPVANQGQVPIPAMTANTVYRNGKRYYSFGNENPSIINDPVYAPYRSQFEIDKDGNTFLPFNIYAGLLQQYYKGGSFLDSLLDRGPELLAGAILTGGIGGLFDPYTLGADAAVGAGAEVAGASSVADYPYWDSNPTTLNDLLTSGAQPGQFTPAPVEGMSLPANLGTGTSIYSLPVNKGNSLTDLFTPSNMKSTYNTVKEAKNLYDMISGPSSGRVPSALPRSMYSLPEQRYLPRTSVGKPTRNISQSNY